MAERLRDYRETLQNMSDWSSRWPVDSTTTATPAETSSPTAVGEVIAIESTTFKPSKRSSMVGAIDANPMVPIERLTTPTKSITNSWGDYSWTRKPRAGGPHSTRGGKTDV